jgi:hypothetical protein
MHEHKRRRRHQYTLVVILPHTAERSSEFLGPVHDERMNFYAEGPSRDSGPLIVLSAHQGNGRECDVLLKERDLRKRRYKRFEKFEALWGEIIAKNLRTCDIAPWPREAVDESGGNEINLGATDHDGNGFRFLLEDLCQARSSNEQYVDVEAH